MSGAREVTSSRAVRRAGVAAAVVAFAAAYLAFVGARLVVFEGDPSGFVTAGDGTTDVTSAPKSLLVATGTDGYDGQAYYRLARDPLTDEVSAEGITFTRPAYWQARIGYPAAAWLLSAGGMAALVPGAMLLVNVLAVVAIAILAARLARELGRSPWWGLVPASWAGYLVGVGQDLTEPLAGALLLGALYAIRVGRPGPAAVALTAAALTRETTLVVAVAVLVASFAALAGTRRSGTRRPSPPWWVGAVPLAAYVGWRIWVGGRWSGLVPDPPTDNPLELPATALVDYLGHAMTHPGAEWSNLVLLVPTLTALVLAATALRDRTEPLHERLALVGCLIVLLCLPVWDRGQAYLRWGCDPMLLGWLLLVGRQRASPHDQESTRSLRGPGEDGALPALAALTAFVWLVAATQSVGYPHLDGSWAGGWTWS